MDMEMGSDASMMMSRSGRLDAVKATRPCPNFFKEEDKENVKTVSGAKVTFDLYCSDSGRSGEECALIEHDAFKTFTDDEQDFTPDATVCDMLDKLFEAATDEELTKKHKVAQAVEGHTMMAGKRGLDSLDFSAYDKSARRRGPHPESVYHRRRR